MIDVDTMDFSDWFPGGSGRLTDAGSMEVPWSFHGGSMEVPWRFHGGSMEVPWRFHGGYMEFSCCFLRRSL